MIQEKKAYSILRNISQSRLYCIWTSLVVLRRVKDTSLGRFVQKWSLFRSETTNFQNLQSLLISSQAVNTNKSVQIAALLLYKCMSILSEYVQVLTT